MKKSSRAILDADFFISYLGVNELSKHAERLYEKIEKAEIIPEVSSELFDDIINAYRSDGYAISQIIPIVESLETIPLIVIPVTATIARMALKIYEAHGGRRRLHYFDAYHVATAKLSKHKSIITSDRYIIEHAKDLEINAIDLRSY